MEHRHGQIHVQNIAISIYIFHHHIASHHKHWCHVDIIIRDDSSSSRSQALEAKSSEYPSHPDKPTIALIGLGLFTFVLTASTGCFSCQ